MSTGRNGMRCVAATLRPGKPELPPAPFRCPITTSAAVVALPPQIWVPTPAPAQSATPHPVDSSGSASSAEETCVPPGPPGADRCDADCADLQQDRRKQSLPSSGSDG